MPAPGSVSQSIQIVGLKEALRATSRLGKDANRELRAAARVIAEGTLRAAKAEAVGVGALQRIAADSLVTRSDRVPRIVAGGTKRIGQHKHQAGGIFFGAEFGGGAKPHTHQFPPHRGQHGYFLWPTIRARESSDIAKYHKAMDKVIRHWSD
jgi:hypothetical protein